MQHGDARRVAAHEVHVVFDDEHDPALGDPLQQLAGGCPLVLAHSGDGFVEQQFTRDVGLGTPTHNRYMFSGSSQRLVAKILRRHNAADVSLIQGDITTIPDSKLPASCSVVLLDIDLAEPTYQTLKRFWPRVAPGGVILVDDCPEEHDWKARIGFSRFCQEAGLPEQYRHGMGILVKGATN